MNAGAKRLKISGWVISLLLCFIWGNSLLPGEISGHISDWVKSLLAALLPGEIPGVTTGGGLLRKLAHLSEFAALGVALCWRFGMQKKRKIWALAYGFGAACVDETIQRFVPERGPSLKDVGIDTCGVALGILLCLSVNYLYNKQKTSKENETL